MIRDLFPPDTPWQCRPHSTPSGKGKALAMTHDLPSPDAAKAQARALRAALSAEGRDISHSAALELVAKSHGFRDWNTLTAAMAVVRPLHPGQRVAGRYLKQPFNAVVIGVTHLSPGRRQVVLHLDQAVDVVEFASFSNLRRRISKVIGDDGRSFDRTSDGVPHLVLD